MSRPAVRAGLVGVGVALVVVIAFELIFAVQALVFLVALPVGLLIGWYALERERVAATERRAVRWPVRWPRVLGDGIVAGLMTGFALAVVYVAIRLLFLYFDNGFSASGPSYACASGPECSYQRALDEPAVRAALEDAGVHDAAGYTAFFLESQALGGGALVALVLAGALAGAVATRAGTSRRTPFTIAPEGPG